MSGNLVLVTGATGFIGSWIIKNLLDQGYSVIGTVRSEDKGKILTETYQSVKFSVIHDLSIPNVYDHVFKDHSDIAYVIHTASPVLASSTDIKKEIIDPAVHGTKSLLSAAKEFGKMSRRLFFIFNCRYDATPSFGNSDQTSLLSRVLRILSMRLLLITKITLNLALNWVM